MAREARSDAIHDATPRLAIEGREIVPDRRAIQGRVVHPRHESSRCVGFPLDVTDNAMLSAGCDSDSELKSANAGA